jgi:hypothetical protein
MNNPSFVVLILVLTLAAAALMAEVRFNSELVLLAGPLD